MNSKKIMKKVGLLVVSGLVLAQATAFAIPLSHGVAKNVTYGRVSSSCYANSNEWAMSTAYKHNGPSGTAGKAYLKLNGITYATPWIMNGNGDSVYKTTTKPEHFGAHSHEYAEGMISK